jgi:hypothetical protein
LVLLRWVTKKVVRCLCAFFVHTSAPRSATFPQIIWGDPPTDGQLTTDVTRIKGVKVRFQESRPGAAGALRVKSGIVPMLTRRNYALPAHKTRDPWAPLAVVSYYLFGPMFKSCSSTYYLPRTNWFPSSCATEDARHLWTSPTLTGAESKVTKQLVLPQLKTYSGACTFCEFYVEIGIF